MCELQELAAERGDCCCGFEGHFEDGCSYGIVYLVMKGRRVVGVVYEILTFTTFTVMMPLNCPAESAGARIQRPCSALSSCVSRG